MLVWNQANRQILFLRMFTLLAFSVANTISSYLRRRQLKFVLNTRTQAFSQIINNTGITNSQHQAFPLEDGISEITKLIASTKDKKGMTYVIGNGGSSAVAGHAVIDLLNMGKIPAMTLHDPATITCLSNDYGYETVYESQLKNLVRPNDLLIAISSSGKSKNILNAVSAAKASNAKVVTLSGFSAENPLRKTGDVNIWLDSSDYGFVEIGHAFILHNITDRLMVNEGIQ